MATSQEQAVLLWIPIGGLLLYFLSKDDNGSNNEAVEATASMVIIAATTETEQAREGSFLEYNKDEVFKNLLAAEGHFRNVKASEKDEAAGFLNCVVKHLADAEGHADEAISHTVATNKVDAQKYQNLRDNIRELRHDVQKGNVAPSEGIKRTRSARHYFEGFNPDFDISKCNACTING